MSTKAIYEVLEANRRGERPSVAALAGALEEMEAIEKAARAVGGMQIEDFGPGVDGMPGIEAVDLLARIAKETA